MHRELEIVKNDLHCNAVRICGQDIDRLVTAGRDALEQGLEVWVSPELWDNSPEDTLDYVMEAPNAPRSYEGTSRARWSSAWAPS